MSHSSGKLDSSAEMGDGDVGGGGGGGDYSLSDFVDEDEFTAEDDAALLAHSDAEVDDDEQTMAELQQDEMVHMEFEKKLADIPSPGAGRDAADGSADVVAATASQPKSAQSTPPRSGDDDDAATVISKTTIKAWESSLASPPPTAPGDSGGSAAAAAAERDVVVLEIDGRLELVDNDDINAQESAIGLAPAAQAANDRNARKRQEEALARDTSEREGADVHRRSAAGNRGVLKLEAGGQPPAAAMYTGSGQRVTSSAEYLSMQPPARAPGKPASAWAAAGAPPKQAKRQAGGGGSGSSAAGLRSASVPPGHFKSGRPMSADDDGAYGAWLARKNTERAQSASTRGPETAQKDRERRKREEGEAAFSSWLSAKQEQTRKEREVKKKIDAKAKEEERERSSRQEMSSDLYEAWVSEKRKQGRITTELTQLEAEYERSRTVEITSGENDAAYKSWLRKKAQEERESREWMAYRRHEHVLEARRIKRAQEARLHHS